MRSGKSIRPSVAAGPFLALLLGACSLGRDVPRVRISSLDDTSGVIQAPEPTEAGWSVVLKNWEKGSVTPTTSGPVVVFGSHESLGTAGRFSVNQVVSLNPADGSVRWVMTIEQPMENGLQDMYQKALDRGNGDSADSETVVVSPNGKYVAIQLEPYMVNGKVKDIADRCMNTVVLDAGVGQEVRTAQVSGLVLGQALAGDSLVVQTAENYFPAGTGVLYVHSLKDVRADPVMMRADQWLVRATANSLMLAPGEHPRRVNTDFPYTVTRMSTSGENLGTLADILDVHPGGWVERLKDSVAAIQEPCVKQSRELTNAEIGTSMDISDMLVDDMILPAGSGLLLERDMWTEQGEKEVRAGWMQARAESKEMSVENVMTIFVDAYVRKAEIEVLSMGKE